MAEQRRREAHTARTRLSGDEALQRRLDAIDQRRSRRSALTMGLFVLFTLSLTLFMIYMILSGTSSQPQLHVLQEDRVVEVVSAQALIQREEMPLHAPASGYLRPIASEGERKAADSLVAYIVPEGFEDLLGQADDLAESISARQLELIRQGDSEDILSPYLAWDQQLIPLVQQMRLQAEDHALDDIRNYNMAMDNIIRLRMRSLLHESYGDETLEALVAEYEQVQAELITHSTALNASEAGHLSFFIDGREHVSVDEGELEEDTREGEDLPVDLGVDDDSDDELTIEAIQDLIQSGTQLAVHDDVAHDGEPVARLITGAWQELHYVLPNDHEWKVDESYRITVPAEGLQIGNCELISVTEVDQMVHLVFRTDQQIEALAARQVITTRIESVSPRALKVPLEAIFIDTRSTDLPQGDGEVYTDAFIGPRPGPELTELLDADDVLPQETLGRYSIYRLESGYVHQVPIEILAETDTYALVRSPEHATSPLTEGNIIILNPESSTAGAALGE